MGSLLVISGGRAAGEPAGRICFVRVKEQGALNRLPVRVWGDHGGSSRKLAELRGGEKKCVSVPQGKWSVDARSSRPNAPKASDPDECRSSALLIEVTKSPTVTLSISPLGRGSTNLCGWNLD